MTAPRATQVVRGELGNLLHDDDLELLELSTSVSKRSLYYQFCFERGVIVYHVDSNGKLKNYPTPNGVEKDKPEWPTGTKTKTICDWGVFLNFWKKHYNHLPCASVENNENDDRPVEESEDENDNDDNQAPHLPHQHALGFEPQEEVVREAYLNVVQADKQRELANKKIANAREDNQNNAPHHLRWYCFIMDYSQNLDLPHYGSEQPVKTYYYCPLNINQFGIVDPSDESLKERLYAFVYHEGEGEKGGNNVASLIMKFLGLPENNLLSETKTGGELTIIMDNCAGQNKNRMVLWLALYLVEK
eukprot:2254075-Ditylum_brightwellii.AAC.2